MTFQESDQQYFERRHDEETAAAEGATDREARIAHLELAARYAQFAAAIRAVEEHLGTGKASDGRHRTTSPGAATNPGPFPSSTSSG